MMRTDRRSVNGKPKRHCRVTRRALLASAALLVTTVGASARIITKVLPWDPNETYPVVPVKPGTPSSCKTTRLLWCVLS